MTKLQAILRRYQFQYKPTAPLHKVVLAAAIVLSSITLITLRLGQMDAEARLENLRSQAAVLEQENQKLENRIAEIGTSDAIRDIAREELGLVDPDTIIIEDAH